MPERDMSGSGIFITFEGVDGSGKSTQQRLLGEFLRERVGELLLTREPGGTPLGERVRELVVASGKLEIAPESELALMFAARAQHLRERILPALQRGAVVLCDRFVDASVAYQGAGRELGEERVWELHRLLCGGVLPDVTFILDVDTQQALARARERIRSSASAESRFEQQGERFFERVAGAYRALAGAHPRRCRLIEVRGTPQETQQEIQQQLLEAFPALQRAVVRGE